MKSRYTTIILRSRKEFCLKPTTAYWENKYLLEENLSKTGYTLAGAGVYLLYALMTVVKFSPVTDFFIIPLGLFAMLLVMGYFHIEQRETLEEINDSIL